MKLKVTRYFLEIIPEGETDEAYIEEVLGLGKEGDKIELIRVNASGLSCIAYLKTKDKYDEM